MHKVNVSQAPVEENPPSPCGLNVTLASISDALDHEDGQSAS